MSEWHGDEDEIYQDEQEIYERIWESKSENYKEEE